MVAPLRDAKGHFLPKNAVIEAPKAVKPKVAEPKTEKVKIVAKPKTAKPKVMADGRRDYTTKWDKAKNEMTCTCGETWKPKFREGNKRLVRGSWICPKGCCKK